MFSFAQLCFLNWSLKRRCDNLVVPFFRNLFSYEQIRDTKYSCHKEGSLLCYVIITLSLYLILPKEFNTHQYWQIRNWFAYCTVKHKPLYPRFSNSTIHVIWSCFYHEFLFAKIQVNTGRAVRQSSMYELIISPRWWRFRCIFI